jgi:uncharacterized protein Yka (UPF0111/DUF47 family)
MISLTKLLKKEDRFLSLLEANAQEARASAKGLAQILTSATPTASLEKLLKSRAREQEISSQIDNLLCESFTTPLEREDIETLSRALYRIPKGIKKFAERYLISAHQLKGVDFSQQITMLEQATETVWRMVCDLKGGPDIADTKANNDTLQKLEGDADKMLAAALQELYHGTHDPLQAIILQDLYEVLERVFDRCRTAGNIMLQIVLKNS